MAKAKNARAWKIGDVVSWVSQAAGSSKVKVGKITEFVPPNGKSGHEYAFVDVLVSYLVSYTKEIGLAKNCTTHREAKKYKPLTSGLNAPSAAETKACNEAIAKMEAK